MQKEESCGGQTPQRLCKIVKRYVRDLNERNQRMILMFKKMISEDFRRRKSVHYFLFYFLFVCFFLFCFVFCFLGNKIYCQNEKKREILFQFWLSWKIQKNMKLFFFSTRRRERKERTLKYLFCHRKTVRKNNGRTGAGVRWKGQSRLGADLIVWKIDPEKVKILIYIFFFRKLSNLLNVTCWSREERTAYCRERTPQPTRESWRKPLHFDQWSQRLNFEVAESNCEWN